jgi:hypothetical protein
MGTFSLPILKIWETALGYFGKGNGLSGSKNVKKFIGKLSDYFQ